VNHGEVRRCRFGAPDHDRPAVILTRDSLIPEVNAVTIAPITTKLRTNDTRVYLDESDGLREPSEVNLLNLQTISKDRVGRLMATLRPERMREVTAAIAYSLGFDRAESD
jgi:mRNA-degrading endonuclease toxin of MazEF toxin-antitoxin module